MTYVVIYYKNGERRSDPADTLETAIADYEDKKALDRSGAFDDRFVSHVESTTGERVYP